MTRTVRYRVVRIVKADDASYRVYTIERLTAERDGGAGWVTVRHENGGIERMRASEFAALLSKREAKRLAALLALAGK